MAFEKVTYEDNKTVIQAKNLNDIQDELAATVKTVNGVAPDENGNVKLSSGSTSLNIRYGRSTSAEQQPQNWSEDYPELTPVYKYLWIEVSVQNGLNASMDCCVVGEYRGNEGSGGLSSTASALLIEILEKVHLYEEDQSGNIKALAAELGVTEEEPDTPVEPDEPVTPEVTLSSISATYSGGDVDVGTAVTDLMGIEVTAHYSDGSTATVTDYTLSGAIAEGSNTITVSYGGKTTTFTVTGVAESGGEPVGVAVAMLDEGILQTHTNVDFYADDALVQQKADDVQPNVKANGSNFNWYEDDGATTYTDGMTTRASIRCFAGATVFDEDTDVKVLIKTYGGQAYDLYVIGCTDWDGVNVPSGKNVYNCQKVGANGWKNGIDHEVTCTVKAGTRLFVASYVTDSIKVCILNPTATITEVSANSSQKVSMSQTVFEKDTIVRIVASSAEKQHDSVWVGCTDHNGAVAGDAYRDFDVFYRENIGDAKWEEPYSTDFTYTVKAGYRLVLGTYWTRADMDVFTITEVT